MEKDYYTKTEVIDYIWQFSKYHGNLLIYCENIAKNETSHGYASLLFLFNITENIFKDSVKDYDGGFYEIIKKLKKQKKITNTEYKFLNDPQNSIRILRNLLAHANLSEFNLVFSEEGRDVFYPLTEDETCKKLYEMLSEILFNLMLRVVAADSLTPLNIKLGEKIKSLEINIKSLSPEELLGYKGIDVATIANWNDLSNIDKYRIAENASDVNMYAAIFQKLLNDDK